MEYLADANYFDDPEEDETVDVCKCDQCDGTFEVEAGEEPDACPLCKIEFD